MEFQAMKAMNMSLKHCRKWANPLMIIMIIIVFNLIHAEATSFQPGRRLVQTQETSIDDTIRVDPLDHFRKYTGGFNITNKHYFSSVIFTGIYGYVTALLWFLAGAVCVIYLLSTTLCCTKRSKMQKIRTPYHKKCYLFPRRIAAAFALLAIIASGVALGGTMQFHTRVSTITSMIMDTANNASNSIHHTTGVLKQMNQSLQSTFTSNVLGLTSFSSDFLTSTSNQLDPVAADIQRKAQRTGDLVNEGLTTMYIPTTIIISLSLVAVIGVSVFGQLRFRRALHTLLMLGWLLTTMCCLSFGVYYSLEKFSGDSCTALQDFQHNPYNSSLGSIIPCDQFVSERALLSYASVEIYETINKVNTMISFTGSDPICNPFTGPPGYLYKPGNCPANTIQIKDIPKVFKRLSCSGNICNFGQFISSSDYNHIEAFTSSVQSLLDGFPEMESLVDCQPIKRTFSLISVNHCKPLQRNIGTTWIAILFLSIMMMAVQLTWMSITHHEQKHHIASGAVEPNDIEANIAPHQIE